jgi:hypothetical protein
VSLVGAVDVIAWNGPTLQMLGLNAREGYLDRDRLAAFSFALNGILFVGLMLWAERSSSLELRRASKWLEVLGIVHVLSALFWNAMSHRGYDNVSRDVWVYLGSALAFTILAPFRSRWRMLVGGLAGLGLGSYLLVELEIVSRKPFIIGVGCAGLAIAIGTFIYVRRAARVDDRKAPKAMG